jgi:hypothetical protein
MRSDLRPRFYRSSPESDPQIRLLRQRFCDQLIVVAPVVSRELVRLFPVFDRVRDSLEFEDIHGRAIWGRYGWFAGAFPAEATPQAGGAGTLEMRLHDWARAWDLDRPWFLDTGLNTLESLWYARSRPDSVRDPEAIAAALERCSEEGGVAQKWSAHAVRAMLDSWRAPDHPQAPWLIVPPSEPRNLAEVQVDLSIAGSFHNGESGASFSERLEKKFESAYQKAWAEIEQATYSVPREKELGEALCWLVQIKTGRDPVSISREAQNSPKTIRRRTGELARLLDIPLRTTPGRPPRKIGHR